MSNGITERDLSRLSDALAAGQEPSASLLPWPFLQELMDLIGCAWISLWGLDAQRGLEYLGQGLGDGDQGELSEQTPGVPVAPAFWAHFWSTPSCCYPDLSGDHRSVTSCTDFSSIRQWRASPMYVDYFAPIHLQYRLMASSPDGYGRKLRLICLRGNGADSDRERLLLTLLRPHIFEIVRASRARRDNPLGLTGRQRQILELVRDGCTNTQIARRMAISEAPYAPT